MQASLPRCSICGSPTPQMELERWGQCCFCEMQNPNG
jgi:predicted nucleic acid-binding Zn ribbon protein